MAMDFSQLLATAGMASPGSGALNDSIARMAASRKRRQSIQSMFEALGNNSAALGSGLLGGRSGVGTASGVALGTKVPGNVDRWITDSMKATGLSSKYRDILRTLVMKESSGRPAAINNWDINAKRGYPTQGIAQTRPDTFAAHRLRGFAGIVPGEGQITDPEENLVAAIRYALGRYGDLNNLPGVVSMRRGGGWKGY